MTRRATPFFVVVLALISVLLPVWSAPAGAVPGPDEEAAAQAAAEIQAARDRANGAAADYLAAQSELEQLTDRAAELVVEQASLQRQVDALREQVEAIAVSRFVSSGSVGIPLLTDYREPSEQLQADALTAVATDTSANAMDEYERLRSELEAVQEEVAATQEDVKEQQEESLRLQEEAEAEVVRLRKAEEQRLEDERVYLAFLAKQAEEARLREEQRQREEAEAAARAEAERQAAEQRAAEDAAAAASAAAASAAAATVAAAAQPAAASDANLPVAPEPDAQTASSGGEAAVEAAEAVTAVASSGGGGGYMICPVVGGSSYADGWGNPRSGGRSHQGVDMMAPSGTTLVAVVSGDVTFKQNSLGGNAVWLKGSNGDSYYYAHLSAFEGSSRSVSQGEVIGYVGDTGNATGVPHLHFEVHPGGGAAVNPYPYVVEAGC